LILLALLDVGLGVPYIAFKAGQNGRDTPGITGPPVVTESGVGCSERNKLGIHLGREYAHDDHAGYEGLDLGPRRRLS
jgi:hypothetical protein